MLVLLCACKAEIGGGSQNDPDGSPSVDSAIDASTIDAPGTFGPWSAPALVPGPNTTIAEDDGSLSNSKLEMIYAKSDPNIDGGRKHLYYISRPTVTSMQWSAPVRLSFNVDGTSDETPRFSADDKTVYFGSNRTGTTGGLDIWQVSRTTLGSPNDFGTPALVAAINSTATDKWFMPCGANHYMMISSRTPSTTDDVWEGTTGNAPTLVTDLSSATTGDTGIFPSADCLTVYFASSRSGPNRIYKSTRASLTAPWSTPAILQDFLTGVPDTVNQEDPWVSADQKTFVFASTSAGSKDEYISTR